MIFLQLMIIVSLQRSANVRSNVVMIEALVPSDWLALHDTHLLMRLDLCADSACLGAISAAMDLPHLDLYRDEDVGCGHPKQHLSITWNLLGRTGAFDCPPDIIVTLGHRSTPMSAFRQCRLSDKRRNWCGVPSRPKIKINSRLPGRNFFALNASNGGAVSG
jgi:hypothetical protein